MISSRFTFGASDINVVVIESLDDSPHPCLVDPLDPRRRRDLIDDKANVNDWRRDPREDNREEWNRGPAR